MRDLYPPVKIISEGWKRIEFPRRVFNDGSSFTPVIPSDTLLGELIRIPQSLWYDPLEFQRYLNQSLPQKYDYKNQKLLRDYSNKLIDELNKDRIGSPQQSETNEFLQDFCNEYSISYEHYEYCSLLTSYCRNILTLTIPSRADRTLEETLLVSRYSNCNTIPDFMKVNSFGTICGRRLVGYSFGQFLEDFCSRELSIQEHQELVEKVLKEYKEVDNNCVQLENYRRERQRLDNIRGNRFLGFGVAVREQNDFIKQVQQIKGVQGYNQAVIAERENSRKTRRKYAVSPCLRQCWYCYRFTLGTGKISNTCGSDECKLCDDARKKFLKYKHQNS
jgi:hypothetical protein